MKLKQKIALSMAAFYLVSVVGVALSFHFCGGQLTNVQIFSNAVSCSLCGAQKLNQKTAPDCCKNTQLYLKVKDDHQAETGFKLPKLFSVDLFLPTLFSQFTSFISTPAISLCTNKAPPKIKKTGIYLLHCVFRN